MSDLRDESWLVWRHCLRVLSEVRADHGSMSDEMLAGLSGYHVKYVRRLMRGQTRLTLESFYALARALCLDPAVIFADAVGAAEADSREPMPPSDL